MKARVTITLSESLLARVDRDVGVRGGASRSAVIEEVLSRHYLDAYARRVAEATVRYYTGRTAADVEEDDAIVGASTRSLSNVLKRSGD